MPLVAAPPLAVKAAEVAPNPVALLSPLSAAPLPVKLCSAAPLSVTTRLEYPPAVVTVAEMPVMLALLISLATFAIVDPVATLTFTPVVAAVSVAAVGAVGVVPFDVIVSCVPALLTVAT